MTGRRSIQLAIKRAMDVFGAVVGLILFAPVFVPIAIAIKLGSRGPVFFCQDRLGIGGVVFRIVKLRTMVVGAPDGAVREGGADPRVNKVGAFLRRWSLDEVPQLVNVLKGEMSLVGPRPDRVFRLAKYTHPQERRLLMKPGMTGLAQVSGRNALSFERRRELDVAYVDGWSIRLDVKILLRTLRMVLNQRGIDWNHECDQFP